MHFLQTLPSDHTAGLEERGNRNIHASRGWYPTNAPAADDLNLVRLAQLMAGRLPRVHSSKRWSGASRAAWFKTEWFSRSRNRLNGRLAPVSHSLHTDKAISMSVSCHSSAQDGHGAAYTLLMDNCAMPLKLRPRHLRRHRCQEQPTPRNGGGCLGIYFWCATLTGASAVHVHFHRSVRKCAVCRPRMRASDFRKSGT